MSCPFTHLVRLLGSGEMPAAQERDLREHLSTCETCAAANAEAEDVWDVLGEWQLDLADVNVKTRILDAAKSEMPAASQSTVSATRWTAGLRVAASVGLAIGLGIAAGHLVPTPPPAPPAAQLDGVSQALELIGIASESSTGLPVGVDPDELHTGEQSS